MLNAPYEFVAIDPTKKGQQVEYCFVYIEREREF